MVGQLHPGAICHAPAFAVVADPAGGHQILPAMLTAQAARDDMVQRQVQVIAPAILTGVIVAAEDFLFVQLDTRAGALDHPLKADHRRSGENGFAGMDLPAAIQQHRGFFGEHQTYGSPDGANIQRFVIRIEDKDRFSKVTLHKSGRRAPV